MWAKEVFYGSVILYELKLWLIPTHHLVLDYCSTVLSMYVCMYWDIYTVWLICNAIVALLKWLFYGPSLVHAHTHPYSYRPQDVLATLLNNLKVQERQMRVCTTVAIAIVAETCSPFTVLPALMNEYRVPELNVQNGVLKSLSFLFEYIGEMGKDYIYAVTPLLEDALMDRYVCGQLSQLPFKYFHGA